MKFSLLLKHSLTLCLLKRLSCCGSNGLLMGPFMVWCLPVPHRALSSGCPHRAHAREHPAQPLWPSGWGRGWTLHGQSVTGHPPPVQAACGPGCLSMRWLYVTDLGWCGLILHVTPHVHQSQQVTPAPSRPSAPGWGPAVLNPPRLCLCFPQPLPSESRWLLCAGNSQIVAYLNTPHK